MILVVTVWTYVSHQHQFAKLSSMKTILVIGKWRVEHLNTILFSNLDTGANRGVGFELVTRFLAMGYSVFGTYRPDTRDDRSVQQVDSKRATSLHELIFHCKAQRYWCEDLRAWISGQSVHRSYSAGIWRCSARCTGQLCRSVSLISLFLTPSYQLILN